MMALLITKNKLEAKSIEIIITHSGKLSLSLPQMKLTAIKLKKMERYKNI